MGKHNVVEFHSREEDLDLDPVTELLRAGAQKLLGEAIEAEVAELLAGYSESQTADGRSIVIRNGYLPERELQTGVGPVTVKIPKVRSRSKAPVTFRSALVPPYVRKTKSLEAALPWLYLKGISSGEMEKRGRILTIIINQGRSEKILGLLQSRPAIVF